MNIYDEHEPRVQLARTAIHEHRRVEHQRPADTPVDTYYADDAEFDRLLEEYGRAEAERWRTLAEELGGQLSDTAQWLHHTKHIYVEGTSPERFEPCPVMPCKPNAEVLRRLQAARKG